MATKSRKTVKSAKSAKKTVQMLKLPGVKVGRNCVYLEEGSRCLRVGPSGTTYDPMDLAIKLGKSDARKLRKALRNNGHKDLVQDTIPPKEMSKRAYNEMREAEYRKYKPYADSDHGDTGSHFA